MLELALTYAQIGSYTVIAFAMMSALTRIEIKAEHVFGWFVLWPVVAVMVAYSTIKKAWA